MYISCLSSATTTLPLPARVKIMLGLLFKKVLIDTNRDRMSNKNKNIITNFITNVLYL